MDKQVGKRLALALALILAACSSPTGPQPTPLTPIAQPQAVMVLWSGNVGNGDRYVFSPAFAEGAVYAAARNGTVSRFDAASGRRVWSVTAIDRLSGGVEWTRSRGEDQPRAGRRHRRIGVRRLVREIGRADEFHASSRFAISRRSSAGRAPKPSSQMARL